MLLGLLSMALVFVSDAPALGAGRYRVASARLSGAVRAADGPALSSDQARAAPPTTPVAPTTVPPPPVQPGSDPTPATSTGGSQPLRPAVLGTDFADPSIVWGGDQWYAFATNAAGHNVQVSASPDLNSWTVPSEAVPTLPGWAFPGYTWAPTVAPIGLHWVMYVSMARLFSGQCIDRLVATAPGGPYAPVAGGPLVCSETGGSGSIDPFPFVAPDGTPYLFWKADGVGTLFGAALTPDGLAFAGPPVRVLAATAGWQHGVIENPSMTSGEGAFWLVYSGASWMTANYAMGFARCDAPLGPCSDVTTSGPWIAGDDNAVGPGGGSLFAGPDFRLRLAYHAWSGGPGYRDGAQRVLHVEPIDIGPDGPALSDQLPVGALEAATREPGGVAVTGWALDPDTPLPVSVGVFVDGQLFTGGPAAADRPDIGATHAFADNAHGYTFDIAPSDGSHHVCVTATDDIGTRSALLSCTDVSVSSLPFGALDRVTRLGGGGLQATGWAIDPATAAPIAADLYVDGSYAGRVTAGDDRADVAAAWPAFGAAHGFSVTLTLPAAGDAHIVCAYAAVQDDQPAPRLGCVNL